MTCMGGPLKSAQLLSGPLAETRHNDKGGGGGGVKKAHPKQARSCFLLRFPAVVSAVPSLEGPPLSEGRPTPTRMQTFFELSWDSDTSWM